MTPKTASAKPKSPMRFVMNALRDASPASLPVEVVPDEQVRAEADALPPDEHHHEVRAHHQHEHREHEEAEVGEEAIETLVAVHVPGREDEDAQADARDDEHEDGRERVELVAPLHVEHRAHAVTLRHVRDGDEHRAARAAPRAPCAASSSASRLPSIRARSDVPASARPRRPESTCRRRSRPRSSRKASATTFAPYETTAARLRRNASATEPTPIEPTSLSEKRNRRPSNPLMAAPSSGRRGTSQMYLCIRFQCKW